MKKKAKTASADDHENHERRKKIIEDPRFSSVHWDPRFQKVPKHNSTVAIDSRFNRMFTDKSFASSSAPSDKRGKPKKQNTGASLRHYYRLEEEEEEKRELEKNEEDAFDDSNTEVVVESESEELDKLGGGESSLSESEESEVGGEGGEEDSSTDEEDDVEVDYDDETPEVEVENVPLIEDGTRRLAAVNMDWRHVRAADLFVVLRSFLPKGGEILSVAVYPSEFGLQRMKEEEIHGPVALFEDEKERKNEEEDDNEIDYEKLRDYEKSRLRYYYAVVECDSVATSEHLYKACDGLEFERSSNLLDLRFIPDSMEFKHPPRDVATETPTGYEGLDFQTKALQHSNIPISWDEDEPQRLKTLRRKFNTDQLAELELKEFLASDESETDDDENDNVMVDALDKNHGKREKYRALLQSGDGSDGDGEHEGQDMEITFNTGLEEISKRVLEKRNKGSESVWEAVLRKTREKKKARKNKSKYSSDDENNNIDEETEQPDDFFIEEPAVKKAKNKNSQAKNDEADQDGDEEAVVSRAELELLLADDKGIDDGPKGYNLKPEKAKGKRRNEVPNEDRLPVVDFDDPRFSTLFTSSLFALDPTDPQFKRSAAYARQLARKQHKDDRHELLENECDKQITSTLLPSGDHQTNANENVNSDILPPKKEKLELSSLIKSVKAKSKQVQLPSNSKKSKKEKKFEHRGMDIVKPELSSLVQAVKKKCNARRKRNFGNI